jgi:hypothetical protein
VTSGAVLVVGPQCSGSKAVARMLITAGGRRDVTGQWYVGGPAGSQSGPRVVHQSFPQGVDWPSIAGLVNHAQAVRAVVCVRSFHPHLSSMVDTDEYDGPGHHPDMETAERVMQRAYAAIFEGLYRLELPYRVVTYRELAEEPQARACLAAWCGVDRVVASEFDFINHNSKWYISE